MTYASRNITYSKHYEKDFPWSKASKKGSHWAYCKWCDKNIDIHSMGRQALVSHSKGEKHKKNQSVHTQILPLTSFVPQKMNLPSNDIPGPPDLKHDETLSEEQRENLSNNVTNKVEPGTLASQVKPKTIYNFLNKDDDTRAVVIWCLNAVMRNFSYRDTAESVEYFSMMFTDSQIASRNAADGCNSQILEQIVRRIRDKIFFFSISH